jgi:hypothetical protein
VVWSRHVAPGGSPAVESDAAGGDALGAGVVGAEAVGDGAAGSFHWMVEPGGSPGVADADGGAEVDGDTVGVEEDGVSPGVFQIIVDSGCGCTDVESADRALWHAARESTTSTTMRLMERVMVMDGVYHAQRRAGAARPSPASEQIEAKSWTPGRERGRRFPIGRERGRRKRT